jgi:hypothetical protein
MSQYWPQITFVTLIVLNLGITLEQHGKPKTGNQSFWISLTSAALTMWLLYAGGFFNIKV